jgi:hypothetical protein
MLKCRLTQGRIPAECIQPGGMGGESMDWRALRWKRAGEPLDETELQRLELELGVTLPPSYRECVRVFHGATPTPQGFDFTDQKLGQMGSCFSLLLEIAEVGNETIRQYLKSYAEDLPIGLMPFGRDPGGDLMCFDYQVSKTKPSVVYWHHERMGDDSVTLLTNSFDEFINSLR